MKKYQHGTATLTVRILNMSMVDKSISFSEIWLNLEQDKMSFYGQGITNLTLIMMPSQKG